MSGSAPGAYALTNLFNGTNYFVVLRAYDRFGVESADSTTVTGMPSVAGGVMGVVAFDRDVYAGTNDVAALTVVDADLNTSTATVQTVHVLVVSDSDAVGIDLVLSETGPNTGWFKTAAAGTALRFSFDASDDAADTLRVAEGDTIRVFYQDALPAGVRTDSATFSAHDSDNDGLPDTWERVHFGGITVANGTTDFDDDGFLDWQEYVAGTDPKDPSSLLRMVSVLVTTNGYEAIVRWTSVTNRTYVLKKSANMRQEFYTLETDLLGVNGTNEYHDIAAPTSMLLRRL